MRLSRTRSAVEYRGTLCCHRKITTPISFLREAIRAVPAVKWALGVGGIMAVIAIVYSFQISPRVAVIGTLIMFLFMGVLVVFARASALGNSVIALPALVFTWFVLLVFMAVTLALLQFFSAAPGSKIVACRSTGSCKARTDPASFAISLTTR